MKYIEVITESGSADTVSAISEKYESTDFRLGIIGDDGKQSMRMLISDDMLQPVLDSLQKFLSSQPATRIVVLPVELEFPKPSDEKRREEDSAAATREALYNDVEKNAHLDLNFLVLVFLSTTVATIGLIENNVAVVIGAMVIAPLLGPNLAFGLSTALGNTDLMKKSALTNITGILLSIILSVIIGIFWQFEVLSPELVARTQVGLDSVVLALASGAAAALSMTTGLSSVLVGVMVAVALLPPAVTVGLMLAHGNTQLAVSAALLLLINLVCINLTSKIVFFIKGIRPRTWYQKKKAHRAMLTYILVWVVTLIILVFFIYGRKALINNG